MDVENHVGGYVMDTRLVEYLAKLFNKKHNEYDIMKSPIALNILNHLVEKIKE